MFIRVNSVKLYYEMVGEGKPIILLHGNGETSRIFDVLIGQLKSDFTVYAIDSRGHGASDPTDEYDYNSMMEDVAAFIQQNGLEKPILYGFSDGGIIGLLLALHYPDRLSKLIISGANLNPEGLKRGWLFFFKLIHLFTHNRLIKLMLTQPDIQPDDLKGIRIPTLVLAGQKDMIRTGHTVEIARHIPQSQLRIIDHENHESYVKNSDKLYPIIKPFLNS